jgi:hypothetical protein
MWKRAENSLHFMRDVMFAEDRSRIRCGHAPLLAVILPFPSFIALALLTFCFPDPDPATILYCLQMLQ